jgi:hypothetical protein
VVTKYAKSAIRNINGSDPEKQIRPAQNNRT